MTFDKDKLAARRERFSRDELPVRLGNVASNLARIAAFASRQEMAEAAIRVVWETKHFTEWAGLSATLPVQAELVTLQRCLVNWQTDGLDIWSRVEKREQVRKMAEHWSRRVLELSGLLSVTT